MHLEHSGTMERTVSDPHTNPADVAEDPVVDRIKDDMASRRISTHIPAPLRKKKYEDQYKKFITPTGNPVVYLQQHMRSKSMSDLANEQKDEEIHRAEINERYGEMEKLKTMLKEEEDTWTSKLQNWKSRRRSVTEDARKRKQERDIIEKDVEIKGLRRRTKTYREIVDEKMRRDKELCNLQDHDEYEFVSPRSSTSGNSSSTKPISTSTYLHDYGEPGPNATGNRKQYGISASTNVSKSLDAGDVFTRISKPTKESILSQDTPVQYKYTSKVTAIINHSHSSSGSSNSDSIDSRKKGAALQQTSSNTTRSYDASVNTNKNTETANTTINFTPSGSRTLPRGFTHNQISKMEPPPQEAKISKTSITVQMRRSASPPTTIERKAQSRIPYVLMRAKNPDARKDRPKSAHDLRSGDNPNWGSSLPRNYRDYSTPKPFVPGSSNFSQYRKTAFASKRSMWENYGKPESQDIPKENTAHPQPIHLPHSETISSKYIQPDSVTPSFLRNKKAQQPPTTDSKSKAHVPAKVPLVTATIAPRSSVVVSSKGIHPLKVPLISKTDVTLQHKTSTLPRSQPDKNLGHTATLTSSGLSMTSPRVSKAATLPRTGSAGTEALFDDMKICINQRPRSEKGFGFTVRGGDDGKPVIVDTVSTGGAADICHLCVSDEILAINEVPLADCKTQDDIVQLIVSSVITGHLSLNIRRYGKTKKASPLRLTGTKVVMTSGGFVQVRSDKSGIQQTKTPHISKFQKELSIPTSDHRGTDANNNQAVCDDLPPPPTMQELEAMNKPTPFQNNRRLPVSSSPLNNLILAASQNSPRSGDDDIDGTSKQESETSSDSFQLNPLSEVNSNRLSTDHQIEEELHDSALQTQKDLMYEEMYEHYDHHRIKEKQNLRLRLQEEQRMLDQEEAQREEARQKLLEEARLEDMRVEEELRRIKAIKQGHQQRRKEMEHMQEQDEPTGRKNVKTAPMQRSSRTNGIGGGTGTHWMVEEAERRRVADMEGRPRMNPLEYGRKDNRGGGGLPDHVIQRLTERTSKTHGHGYNPNMSDPHFWNDPSVKATLL